ncbi:hypothetical protein PEL8287_01222 [Roseovarius litorisediminis]|uniref:Membrane transport protein MerF n=1 Tax=Roseovarius litorisediminis TaxID=1312363 RepID=A0A1Y5RVX9_9RHOB|nr:hypothetical protein [Roseovarius litorisediminis]SLN26311.1 hypothetical protein PEL8287_01222 [Roseovarius litorisediminis]
MLARVMTWVGGLGAVTALLCCFTGLLPMIIGAFGLTSLLPILYKDSVLFPVAGGFLVLLAVGVYLQRGRA